MRWLAFFFGEFVYRLNSCLVTGLLRLRGVRVGKGLYIQGVPRLKIRGRAKDITIGNNVKILGDIDIRNREKGAIIIEDDVTIDEGCRLVAANLATLRIGKESRIGLFTVINCGDDILIGARVLVSGFCYIQSSNHGIKKGIPVQYQPHTYGKIKIGADVWLGSHVTILPNVTIGDGAVIGAKAVVSRSIRENGIFAGVPAKEIGERQ